MTDIPLNVSAFARLLEANWAEIVETAQLRHALSELAQDSEFPTREQAEIPRRAATVRCTHAELWPEDGWLELWFEYTQPRGHGVVAGTAVYTLGADLVLRLKESYGTVLVAEP